MNNDLISREALKKAIDTIKQTGYDTDNEPLFEYVDLLDLIKAIDNATAVDTYTEEDIHYAIKEGHQVGYEMAKAKFERPQGHWIDDNGEGSYYANCSCCGYQIDTHCERGYLNFCPNCGADMSQHDSNLCDRAIADLSKCIDDMYDKLKEENRADLRYKEAEND